MGDLDRFLNSSDTSSHIILFADQGDFNLRCARTTKREENNGKQL